MYTVSCTGAQTQAPGQFTGYWTVDSSGTKYVSYTSAQTQAPGQFTGYCTVPARLLVACAFYR
jgi:hypothetical protein